MNKQKIRTVERKLGHKLPDSYVKYLETNKDYLLDDTLVIPVKGPVPDQLSYYLGEGFWEINSMYRVSGNENDKTGILYGKKLAGKWGLPEDIIPLEGDGHTWVAFDYRDKGKDEPRIVFIEPENSLTFELADSFSAFLRKLIPYDEVFDYEGNLKYDK